MDFLGASINYSSPFRCYLDIGYLTSLFFKNKRQFEYEMNVPYPNT